MSHAKTKAAILNALRLPNTPVIALTGKWGSGKTHLWKDLASELSDSKEISPLYLSVLSNRSMDALKTALMTGLATGARSNYLNGSTDPGINKLIKNALKLLPKQFTMAMSDSYLLLPKLRDKLPKNLLIAFDDIERAETIDVSELLGFIDFLTEQLDVTVLLILNAEELSNDSKSTWETLKEKIISREIQLTVSKDEVADIGLKGMAPIEGDAIRKRLNLLDIQNIRIIQHIRRVWENIRGDRSLTHGHADAIAKSIVLFTALHFKALDGWPTIEYITDLGHWTLWSTDEDLTDDERRWNSKIREYNMGNPDKFELDVLLPLLRTGHLNTVALESYFEQVDIMLLQNSAQQKLRDFALKVDWDPRITVEELVVGASHCMQDLNYYTAADVTHLFNLTKSFDEPLADHLVSEWLALREDEISEIQIAEYTSDVYGTYADEIQKRYNQRYEELYPPLTLMQAVEHCATKAGQGDRKSHAINSATQSDFEHILLNGSANDQRLLNKVFFSILAGRVLNSPFSKAANTFREAIAKLAHEHPTGRIPRLWAHILALPKNDGPPN